MAFLAHFDQLMADGQKEAATAFLYEKILDEHERDAVFDELRSDRPILKFWSLYPGNLNDPAYKDKPLPDYAYLLVRRDDVKHALAHFNMKPLVGAGGFREPGDPRKAQFILSIDEGNDDGGGHGNARRSLTRALHDEYYIDKIDEAVVEAWENAGKGPDYDFRAFSREVSIRFIGKFIGIPEAGIFSGTENLEKWSLQGYENFIWKIHARHFVTTDDIDLSVGQNALGEIARLVAGQFQKPVPGTVIHRFLLDRGTFTPAGMVTNIVGSIQGLVDNAMTGACFALNQMLEQPEMLAEAIKHRDNPRELKIVMQEAQRLDAPSPFLPRRGDLSELNFNDAHADEVNVACAIGAAMTEPDPSKPEPGRMGAWEMRVGYGIHECIGKYIGDDVMVRAIAKILQLENLERATPLAKRWGWIVEELKVTGTN